MAPKAAAPTAAETVKAPGGWADAFNERMMKSWIGRYFEIEQRNTTFLQEVRAGTVMFLTVCYIIPVNSAILADTGGSCDPAVNCNPERYALKGPYCKYDDFNTNPEWGECIATMRQNLIAATCIAGMIATFGMALIARMPLAVAPAMGVNAYFTYTVVGYMGFGRVSYSAALAAAFVEGWIFLALSISGVRGRLIELIPKPVLYATAVGIGCFLAFIGLQKSEGLGIITYDGATLVTLGGCTPNEQAHTYMMRDWDAYWHDFCWNAFVQSNHADNLTCGTCAEARKYFLDEKGLTLPIDPVLQCTTSVFLPPWADGKSIAPDANVGLPPKSANYGCMGNQMRSPFMWLGIAGGFVMVILMMRGVKASILVGILMVTFIAWIPGDESTCSNQATYFKACSQIPGGEERYQFFLKGATTPSVAMSGGQLDFAALSHVDTWIALITFLYLDFLDATSTMITMARMINSRVPGFLNAKGQWPRQLLTMCMDGSAIIIGSTLGTSPLTILAESSVGIREGGHTGICAFICAIGFGISMFLSPIFASIPPYATGPAIVFVGALMFEHCTMVKWHDVRHAVPAFLTIIMMPLTYSIAYGVIVGIFASTALWTADFSCDALGSLIWNTRPMREVWLDHMSHFYKAFNKEQMLIDELPGYTPDNLMDAGDSGHRDSDAPQTGDERNDVQLTVRASYSKLSRPSQGTTMKRNSYSGKS